MSITNRIDISSSYINNLLAPTILLVTLVVKVL